MASLPDASAITCEIRLSFREAMTIEVLSLGETRILQPKLFPHVHIDIAQIWPD